MNESFLDRLKSKSFPEWRKFSQRLAVGLSVLALCALASQGVSVRAQDESRPEASIGCKDKGLFVNIEWKNPPDNSPRTPFRGLLVTRSGKVQRIYAVHQGYDIDGDSHWSYFSEGDYQ